MSTIKDENRRPAGASETGDGDCPPLEPRRPRGVGQRIAFFTALLRYLCACLCLGAIPIWITDLGGEHPVIASLGASVVFFAGAGIVLHVIARANLPDLGFGADRAEGNDQQHG